MKVSERENTLRIIRNAINGIVSINQLQLDIYVDQARCENKKNPFWSGVVVILLIPLWIYLLIRYMIFWAQNLWGLLGVLILAFIGWFLTEAAFIMFQEKYLVDNKKLEELRKRVELHQNMIATIMQSPELCEARCFIPQAYFTLDALSCMFVYLENKRADTFKEAANIYESDLQHRELVNLHRQEIAAIQSSVAANAVFNERILQSQKKAMAFQKKAAGDSLRYQKELLKNAEKISKQERFGNILGTVNTVKHWKS